MFDHLFQELAADQAADEQAVIRNNAIADKILDSLFYQQRQVIEDPFKWKAALCPRRAGKSWTAMSYAFHTALTKPGSNSVICTLTLKTARRIYWSAIQKYIRLYAIPLRYEEDGRTGIHHTELRVTLENGSTIFLMGAETRNEIEKIRGDSYDLVVIDECKSFSPGLLNELIEDAVEPATDDREGSVLLIGTPGNILAGPFYEATQPTYKDSEGAPVSRSYIDPDPFWTSSEHGPLWSRHQWGRKDNEFLPKLWQQALDRKKRKKWADDHPTWLREYMGQWVADDSIYVYDYATIIHTDRESVQWVPHPTKENPAGLPEGHEWRFLLGIDYGWRDETAICVGAYSLTSDTLYHCWEWKASHQTIDVLAAKIKEAEALFGSFDAMVADTGGKQTSEDMNKLFGTHIVNAEKRDKNDYIELLNADFHRGHVKIMRGSDLGREMECLQWDLEDDKKDQLIAQGRLKEHHAFPNHLCDAFLYLWRCSYHRYSAPKPVEIEVGSELWWQRWEERNIQETLDRSHKATSVFDTVQTRSNTDPLRKFYRN